MAFNQHCQYGNAIQELLDVSITNAKHNSLKGNITQYDIFEGHWILFLHKFSKHDSIDLSTVDIS